MENPFARKVPKRHRRKKKKSSSSSTSNSLASSLASSLLTKNSADHNSETYEESWKKDEKQVISKNISENTEDGYESDHVPSLPQRCALTLNLNFSTGGDKNRKSSRKLLSFQQNSNQAQLPKTAPPSPASESSDGIPFIPPPQTASSSSNSSYSYPQSSPSSYQQHYRHEADNLHISDKISPSSIPPNAITSLKYSLRSMIGDGTDQPNGPTIMQRRSLSPNKVHVNTSHWSSHGLRPYMEDRYIADHLSSDTSYFGVFDGHGGQEASQFCCDHFHHYFRYNSSQNKKDIPTSFQKTFQQMDDDIVRSGYTDGSTACVCLLQQHSKIYCANAGDSRAIVIRRDGSVACLSRDHKPGVPDESQRITDLGGRIVYFGRWRVEGILAVSRSLGDASLKPFITAFPEVCEYNIEDDDLLLVVATDGIWDVMNNLKVADILLNEIYSIQLSDDDVYETNPDRFKSAAQKLCNIAG